MTMIDIKKEEPSTSEELINYLQRTYINGYYPMRVGHISNGYFSYWVEGSIKPGDLFNPVRISIKQIQQEMRHEWFEIYNDPCFDISLPNKEFEDYWNNAMDYYFWKYGKDHYSRALAFKLYDEYMLVSERERKLNLLLKKK